MQMTSVNLRDFPQKGFVYGMRQQLRVVSALVVRETATRFGRRSLGFLWAFLEPAVYIMIFVSLHSIVRATVPFGESAMVFFTVGVVVFRLYVSIASHCMSAITANQALLSYPLVRPLDTILARVILECIVMLIIAAVVFVFVGIYLGRDMVIYPSELIEGMIATIFLAASVGTFNAVISALLPSWANFHAMLSLPLLVTSGLFYVPAVMPPIILDIIIWNPVLHCIEWIRGATYIHYLSVLDRGYIITFATVALALSLTVERLFRNKLIRP
jgi:capsular polysaccharide transport system permease protein